jgi:RNA polymerase sigma factor, sigma-70 family
MSSAATRQQVITELYDLYVANGYITEDAALACFAVHKMPLSEIDSVTENLLGIGVLFRFDEDEDEVESLSDRSRLDYNEIFEEVLEIAPGLRVFIDYVREIAPPQNREWQKLIPQVQSENEYAQTRLIEMYLRTVIKQSLYYSKKYVLPLEDTIQDGILGIMTAVKKFNPSSHDKFSTYAPWWITQSIARRRWVPENPMYFPVHVKDRLFLIQEQVRTHICDICGEDNLMVCPTLCLEISQKHDMATEESRELVFYFKQWCSIDAFEEDSELFTDHGISQELFFERAELSETFVRLKRKIAELTDKEQRVLTLRYGLTGEEEKTLESVGSILNVTRERIRQIESKALRKLRKKFGIKDQSENKLLSE